MTATEIREALHGIAAGTVPPAPDRVAVQRLARAERRRHRLRGAAALGGAAAVVVGLAAGAVQLSGVGGTDPAPAPATVSPDRRAVSPPASTIYFLEDHRLVALDPEGIVHDLGASEEVLGSTTEGVWAFDDDSHLVWYAARHADGGTGAGGYSFERAPNPPGVVDHSVQRAALSADGRYLAWMDTDGAVSTYDLQADAGLLGEDGTPENTALVDVGPEGLLLSEDGDLVLRRTDGSSVPVPTEGDGYGLASSLAGDVVAVGDRDGFTRMYRLGRSTAEEVATIPGDLGGDLSPDGHTFAALSRNEEDTGTVLSLWADGSSQDVSGIDGMPESLQWVDEQTLLVATGAASGSRLYSCDTPSASCVLVHTGRDVRLPGQGY